MKRLFDILITTILLLTLFPVIFIIFILVTVDLGFPVLFSQKRPGRNGKIFKIFKFRTMKTSKGTDGLDLADDVRLTKFGTFLRSTSLDELPGLFNVLKGDMSLVGPRPLLPEYLPLYNKIQSKRHNVRPGITGWAQVNGRNAISWNEKFELDVWYVENQSFLLDIRILLLTIKKVFQRQGINANGHATIEPFRGNDN